MTKFENFIKNQIIPTLPQMLPSWGKQSHNTGEREMSKSEHTPGPWEVAFRADGSSYISMGCPAAGQHKQFDLMLVAGSGNDEEDARLIAAAPDLLESLTNLVGLAKLGAASLDKYHAALSDAEAALAKARGEA